MGEWGEATHSSDCKRIRRSCFNVFMTPFPDSADPSNEPKNTSRPDGIFHPDSTFNTSHSDSSSSISRSGGISHPEGDPLLDILPTAADADRPWLVWYSPDERIELTGHVLSMWAAKTAGLLSAEAGGRPRVHVALEPGWRALTWCLGTWLTGGRVLMGPAALLGAAGTHEPDASVADRPEALAPRKGPTTPTRSPAPSPAPRSASSPSRRSMPSARRCWTRAARGSSPPSPSTGPSPASTTRRSSWSRAPTAWTTRARF